MHPSLKMIFGAVIFFAVGVAVGFFGFLYADQYQHAEANSGSKQVRELGGYRYINPLLECEVAEGTIDARKHNFSKELNQVVQTVKQSRSLTEAAVYFRDLNNGPAFGVDEEGEFFPASLLKVPVMMAYYRWAEQEPGLLSKEVVFESPVDFGVSVSIKPREELSPGKSYTLDELIERMIVYSDNQALALLTARLPQERIEGLFRIVGVGADVLSNPEAKLTVKEYTSFFRILFNSSYLVRENSEKALSLLARTDYADALSAPIPKNIEVAHKFGEAGTGTEERQLHDCGIVYFPNHPYLACVMTRGRKNEDLKSGIQDISQFIYSKINEQYE